VVLVFQSELTESVYLAWRECKS